MFTSKKCHSGELTDNLGIPGAPTTVTIVGTATSEFWTAAGAGITAVPTGTTIVSNDCVVK